MSHYNGITRTALAVALAAALAAPAFGQDSASKDTKDATAIKTVVVTGTRAFNRTEADSMAPIDVLTADRPQGHRRGQSGHGAAHAAAVVSTFRSRRSPTPPTPPNRPSCAAFRRTKTLVLINGKRQHTTSIVNVNGSLGRGSSPVDINAIPINAIDHIEVLRDGAAAQYGSDAIAGVINIILKGGAKHGSVNVTRGQWDGGDGDTWQGGADGGFNLGSKGWVHLSANYTKQGPDQPRRPRHALIRVTPPTAR